MDIKYDEAAPLRYSQCRAWLVEWGAGGKDVLLTAEDMEVEAVVHMLNVHSHDNFTIANITVGCYPVDQKAKIPSHLEGFYSAYFGDGRKIDNDMMVQL